MRGKVFWATTAGQCTDLRPRTARCCYQRAVKQDESTEPSADPFGGETAWATQAQMAELFGTSQRNIGLPL